jgi:hypothetical protein
VETNVIARSDDRATITDVDDNRCAKSHRPLRKGLQSSAQRTPILCAKDSNPLRKGLQSSAQGTPILCARDSNPLRKGLPSFARVVARSSLRAITFAPKLRYAPFRRSHPSPLLRSTTTSSVVAIAQLGQMAHRVVEGFRAEGT